MEKIASKVEDFSVVGDYLYYIAVPHIGTRLPGDTASVYVKKGEEAPVKIPQASSFSFFSDDGAILFFFSDNNTETINGEKNTYGNLLSFTYGDTAVKQIDSNVINNSLISGRIARQSVLRSLSPRGNGRYVRAVDPSSFTYRIFKYSSSNKYFYGLKYYNGKEIIEGSKQAIQYIGQ